MSVDNVLYGVDASKWQGIVIWRQVAKEGFSFAISKATEGLYYEDKYLKRNLYWSEQRGLISGAYLFLTSQNVKKQVDKFLAAVGDVDGKLIALDCEDPRWGGVEGRGQPSITDVWNAVHYLRERIGDHPILIYSGNWWWERMGSPDVSSLVDGKDCRLWVSRYVNGTGYASTLYQKVPDAWWQGKDGGGFGGEKPTILQFSEQAKIAGKRMDANSFRGSLDELKRLASSNPEPVKPDPPDVNGYYVGATKGDLTKEQANRIAANHKEAGWEVAIGET